MVVARSDQASLLPPTCAHRCSHGPLTVVFQDRQNISLTFSLEGGVTKEWQVGEQLLRRESHLDKVTQEGWGPPRWRGSSHCWAGMREHPQHPLAQA
jgi:hypothetical protein